MSLLVPTQAAEGATTLPPLDLSLRVGCECVYRANAQTLMVSALKPRQGPLQRIREERFHFEPALVVEEQDDEHGNTLHRLRLEAGLNLLRYDAIVRVPSEREDAWRKDGFHPPHELPGDVIRYVLPSRYVDSDKLRGLAFQRFGLLKPGLTQVQAICEWLHHEALEYRTGTGDATLSAFEVLQRGHGVCRDLAHCGVALCRALNIPARYVSGYVPDIGVASSGAEEDFHAYFEVYLGHRWQTFDARFLKPRVGRIKIAHGLDAVSCAISTVFGAAALTRFEVWAYQVDPAQVSTASPVDLRLRLDGTPTIRRV